MPDGRAPSAGPAIRRREPEPTAYGMMAAPTSTERTPVTDTGHSRIAVLIDADNTSASHVRDLLEEIAKYGVATVKRAYGDWTTTQLSGWKSELNRSAITPIQQFAYTRGKNATDSALIIDAMDLLYSEKLDAFAIVSSDSDFTRLATRLRESGKTVFGLGRRKTPQSFVAACDRFIFLEVLATGAETGDDPGRGGPARQPSGDESAVRDESDGEDALPELRRLLVKAVESTSQDDGWTTLSAMGNYLSNSTASFDPRNYGFGKLSTLVRAQSYLEAKAPEAGSGGAAMVRLSPTRTASRAPRRARSAVTAKGSAPS